MRKLMLRVFSYFSHSLADMFLALVLFIYIYSSAGFSDQKVS